MRFLLPMFLLVARASVAFAQADLCHPRPGALPPSKDLFCIPLSASASGGNASGTVSLDYIPGPFTIPLTRDGHYRYRATVRVHGLPASRPGRRYVVWAAAPDMSEIQRVGVLRKGGATNGEVTLDRFAILVSAERDSSVREREGPVVLRGESPSNRMRPPDVTQLSLGGVMPAETGYAGWHGVPMTPHISMLPAEMALVPQATPWLPGYSPALAEALPPSTIALRDGDTLELDAAPARRRIAGHDIVVYAINGQQPAPLLTVTQGARITVRFTNRLGRPSSIHWHGVRLDNRFDGAAGLTQDAIAPGASFSYSVRFPDPGIFWYHPHVREDTEQDLGLYGNILVRPSGTGPYGPANGEELLLLDDALLGENGQVAWGAETPTHALMGRFGNVLLVNGQERWSRRAHRGEVIRFLLTNASNTRTFNISIDSVRLKLVGTDLGPFASEQWVPSVVIGPAERYVVEARFDRPGRTALVNRVRVLDRLFGRFIETTDTLGIIDVDEQPATPDVSARFERRTHPEVAGEIARLMHRAGPSRELVLTMRTEGLPFVSRRLMAMDSAWFAPVEWGAAMPAMNWATTGRQVHWILRDPATGREGMDIGWRFPRGTVLRLRILNDRDVLHGMQHPIHLHGQRFAVVAVNGTPIADLAWKDTVLIPSGQAVDLLVDLSNPGQWMMHCHIAEHLESGMMTSIVVE